MHCNFLLLLLLYLFYYSTSSIFTNVYWNYFFQYISTWSTHSSAYADFAILFVINTLERLTILTSLSARYCSLLFTTRHYRSIHLLFYDRSYLQPKPWVALCSAAITHLFFFSKFHRFCHRYFCGRRGWTVKRTSLRNSNKEFWYNK